MTTELGPPHTRHLVVDNCFFRQLKVKTKIKVFPGLELNFGKIPNEFRQLSKGAFKKHFHDLLLSIMEAENDYVEVPILLQNIANSAATEQEHFRTNAGKRTTMAMAVKLWQELPIELKHVKHFNFRKKVKQYLLVKQIHCKS